MKIYIKKHLIQEGISQGISDHWGKGLAVIGGLAAANAGVFGPKAETAVQNGGTALQGFMKDAGDFGAQSMEKMADKYGKDYNGDGNNTLIPRSENDNTTPSNPSTPDDSNIMDNAIDPNVLSNIG